jgi:hypothetical protein
MIPEEHTAVSLPLSLFSENDEIATRKRRLFCSLFASSSDKRCRIVSIREQLRARGTASGEDAISSGRKRRRRREGERCSKDHISLSLALSHLLKENSNDVPSLLYCTAL